MFSASQTRLMLQEKGKRRMLPAYNFSAPPGAETSRSSDPLICGSTTALMSLVPLFTLLFSSASGQKRR